MENAKEFRMFNVKKIAALGPIALMAAGMTFVGCMEQGAPSVQNDKPVLMSVKVGVDPVNSLAKGSLISLKKLIVVLSTTDTTIRDTTLVGSNGFVATSTAGQTIIKNYVLKPLRVWTITATTKDNLDTVIHTATVSTVTPLNDGDTAAVVLNLSSRFSMYQAQFAIPDSIKSSVSGTSKQIVNINRLVLKIDGAAVKDSTAGTVFTPLATAILSYDYVPVGTHTAQLLAYGPMYSWNAANPLYTSPLDTLNVAAGVNDTVGITLAWTGPTTGTGNIKAIIGPVGNVVVKGTLPTTVIP